MFFLTNLNNININIGKNWIKLFNSEYTFIKKKNYNTFLIKKNNKLYLLNKIDKNLEFIRNLKNLIYGLNNNFIFKIILYGIGFKININKNILELKLGFSHIIKYKLPTDINFYQPKNRIPVYLIVGPEYNKVTQVALEICNLKKPEPYKGKGFRFFNQIIKRKEGKNNNV
jgi:large subunit ribosomal protein L6